MLITAAIALTVASAAPVYYLMTRRSRTFQVVGAMMGLDLLGSVLSLVSDLLDSI